MGDRINIVILNPKDKSVGIVLYANSNHPEVDVESILREEADYAFDNGSMDSFIRALLSHTYPNADGGERKGDFVFSVDLEQDYHDKVFVVDSELNIRETTNDFVVRYTETWASAPAGIDNPARVGQLSPGHYI